MSLFAQFAINAGRDPGVSAFHVEQWLRQKGISCEPFSQLVASDDYDMATTLEVDALDVEPLRGQLDDLLFSIDGIAGHSIDLIGDVESQLVVPSAGPRARLSVLAE